MLAIWLTLSTLSATGPTDLVEAPELPPWPAGLSRTIREVDGRRCMLPDLADAVESRLEACSVLPERCAVRLVALRDALVSECDSRVYLGRIVAPAPTSTVWRLVAVGAGGFLLGAAATVLACRLDGR